MVYLIYTIISFQTVILPNTLSLFSSPFFSIILIRPSCCWQAYNKKKQENIARMMAGIIRTTVSNIESETGQKLADALKAEGNFTWL